MKKEFINKNVIGILGGMGPQASAKLVEILVEISAKNGAKDDSDFPEIILGCTELPLIFPKMFSIPVFDSLEILAKALLRNSYEGNTIRT